MLVQIFRNFLSDNPVSHEIKRAAAVVKTLYKNGLHTVLPVFYKASSILATIPATSCSAERFFSGLPRVKTYLRSTMGQERLRSVFLFFAWNEHILIQLLKMTWTELLMFLAIEATVPHISFDNIYKLI